MILITLSLISSPENVDITQIAIAPDRRSHLLILEAGLAVAALSRSCSWETWRGIAIAAVAVGTVAACLCTLSWQSERRQIIQSPSVNHISLAKVRSNEEQINVMYLIV